MWKANTFFELMTVLSLVLFKFASTCDTTTANMLVEYAKNEQKPTALVLYKLCCNRIEQMKFYQTITTAGFFVTTSMQEKKPDFRRHEMLLIADLDCPQTIRMLHEAMQMKWMKSPLRWLILRDARNGSRHLDINYQELMSFDILPDSDLVIADRLGTNRFEFTEVYKPASTSSVVETPRGWWSDGVFHDTRLRRELYRRRRNLMKTPLTVSNVVFDSNDTRVHLVKEDLLNPVHDVISKGSWSILRIGIEAINATPLYIFSNSFGYKEAAGTFTNGSMISDLITNKADLGTNCLITQDRLEFVDYSTMATPLVLRFILRQPSLSYVSNIYALPFSIGVWLAICVCLLLSGMALLLTSKWEAVSDKESGLSEKKTNRLSGRAGDVFLLTMSALFQQGCDMEPRNTSGRVMTVILFASLMALYSAYSANIVVLLQAQSNAINNLQSLYNSKFTLAANDLLYSDYLFKREKEGLRRAIYEKRVAPPGGKKHYYQLEEGVKRIKQGSFAFHSVTDPVYRRIDETFSEAEKCDLVEIDYANEADPYLPMQKHSPYAEIFRVIFKQVRETGLQSAINRRLRVYKPKCSGSVGSFSSVGIIEFYPAMLLMFYGFALAVAILILEIICYRVLKIRKQTITFLH